MKAVAEGTRDTGPKTPPGTVWCIREGIPRPVEVVLALFGLIAALPLIGLAALAVLVTSKGGVFFKQRRVGRYGRLFVLLKLRTMIVSNIGPEVTAENDSRMTCVGRILRKTKLDEVPQLWNVIKGDMSIVGPRPEVPRYVNLRDPRWEAVLGVRPGLTDPVTLQLCNEEQLLARVGGDVEKFYVEALQPRKLSGYLEYLSMRSWSSDLAVLLRTALAIVLRDKSPAPTTETVLLEADAAEKNSPVKELCL